MYQTEVKEVLEGHVPFLGDVVLVVGDLVGQKVVQSQAGHQEGSKQDDKHELAAGVYHA